MRIGILTFHWATNYGAILQAYALQSYLEDIGHKVDIINYKPHQYDYSLLNLIKHPSLLRRCWRFYLNSKKDSILEEFRLKYLKLSERYYSVNELTKVENNYDVFISGSDQVLNPSSTMTGENGRPSFAYWLSFCSSDKKRIGYAVSFGCERYPDNASREARKWVNSFDYIGTREESGIKILDDLEYKGEKCLVPDPTILLGDKIFQKLNISRHYNSIEYLCVYMLRYEVHVEGLVRYIDEKHKPLTVEEWLKTIIHSKGLITNSYHGIIIAILSHVPFVALLETGEGRGMNDRFKTLFKRLNIENRAVSCLDEALNILEVPIDFSLLDSKIDSFRKEGELFIKNSLFNNKVL